MKCHYEVLGVTPDCSADDLKKAYRKLALEWHPDKNLDRLDEAKEVFQLIQQAYEILTDPQERAWYDRHKDDILRGGTEEAYKYDCLDVYQYFNTSCFKGYNDDEKGFYTVYRQVFETITAQDKPFMDEDADIEVPQFGYSYSSYEEVVHNFYAYWQSYCTAKSYSWVDKLDLCEARKSGVGRQVIRMIEKENKKLRDQHKKMRNEEVRELVAFVRKRDKRVQAHKKLMEEKKAEKAKQAAERRRKQLQERNKGFENYKESEWSSMSQFEEHFNVIESTLDETFGTNSSDAPADDEMDDSQDLYCPACEKDFRSIKAMKNHENSKKHKDNVLLLKTLLEEEDTLQNECEEENSNASDDDNLSDFSNSEEASSEALLGELIKSSTKTKRKKKKSKVIIADELRTHDEDETNVQLNIDGIKIVDDSTTEEALCNVQNSNADETVSKPSAKSDTVKKKGKKAKVKTVINTDSVPEKDKDETEKPSTVCETCNTNFKSRNKLFDHLKASGHAAYKNTSNSTECSKKQRRKKL